MFRVIGGAVVYGLALYGVVKLVDCPKVKTVIRPGVGEQSADRSGEAVSSAASTPADTAH